MTSARQMHLGLFILGTGSHIAGWRYPGALDTFQDLGAIQEIGRTAERGKFDLIFMGNNLYADPGSHPSYTLRLEPLTMMAALAMSTSRIGLGATASTTYNDPFSVARAFASLDEVTGIDLDTEAAELLRYQQAYSASAQVVTAVNKMFDTLISAMR